MRLLLGVVLIMMSASIAAAQDQNQTQSDDRPLSLDAAFIEAESYEFGDSERALRVIRNAVWTAAGADNQRTNLEAQLVALLRSDDATTAAKSFACRQLMLIGTEASVEPLAALLDDAELAAFARYALERIPSPGAAAAVAAHPQSAADRITPSPELDRWAALAELVQAKPAAAIGDVVAGLQSQDAQTRQAASWLLIRASGGESISRAFSALLPELGPEGQIVLIEALAARGHESAADAIRALIEAPDARVADAAIRAIGTLGNADDVPLLISLAAVGNETARRALHSLPAPGVDAQLLDLSRSEDHAIEALSALGARQVTQSAQELRAIGGDENLPSRTRIAAYLALLEMTRPDAVREREQLVRDAVYASRNWEELRIVLGEMVHTPTVQVMIFAVPYVNTRQVGREAALTVVAIARVVGDEHREPALEAINIVRARFADDDEIMTAANEAVSHIDRRIGFITDWMMAGPFTAEEVSADALLDVPFAPEEGGDVEWRPVSEDAFDDPGIVNLARAIGGSNRVAYLRAVIHTENEKDALLEIGSDDGVKVWLNDKLVHENNTVRGLSPGQDKMQVTLQSGANTILMKISQGGGEWKGCLRLRTPDGLELKDVRIGDENATTEAQRH